jgi:hypothetical protein
MELVGSRLLIVFVFVILGYSVSEKEKIVDLSSMKLAGKLTQGTPSLPSFKEDHRNLATPG